MYGIIESSGLEELFKILGLTLQPSTIPLASKPSQPAPDPDAS